MKPLVGIWGVVPVIHLYHPFSIPVTTVGSTKYDLPFSGFPPQFPKPPATSAIMFLPDWAKQAEPVPQLRTRRRAHPGLRRPEVLGAGRVQRIGQHALLRRLQGRRLVLPPRHLAGQRSSNSRGSQPTSPGPPSFFWAGRVVGAHFL